MYRKVAVIAITAMFGVACSDSPSQVDVPPVARDMCIDFGIDCDEDYIPPSVNISIKENFWTSGYTATITWDATTSSTIMVFSMSSSGWFANKGWNNGRTSGHVELSLPKSGGPCDDWLGDEDQMVDIEADADGASQNQSVLVDCVFMTPH